MMKMKHPLITLSLIGSLYCTPLFAMGSSSNTEQQSENDTTTTTVASDTKMGSGSSITQLGTKTAQ